ncbi:MAG: DUF805 domain-containing protein [Litorimonas sp.]
MYQRSVSFPEAVRLGFSKYFDFSGRAQRSEYWFFILFTVIGSIAGTAVDAALFGTGDEGGPVSGLFFLATFIPSLSVGWRRLHDTNRSGLWILLPYATLIWMIAALIVLGINEDGTGVGAVAIGGVFAFFASLVWVIVMLAQDGDETTNRYGPSPKYDETAFDEIAP